MSSDGAWQWVWVPSNNTPPTTPQQHYAPDATYNFYATDPAPYDYSWHRPLRSPSPPDPNWRPTRMPPVPVPSAGMTLAQQRAVAMGPRPPAEPPPGYVRNAVDPMVPSSAPPLRINRFAEAPMPQAKAMPRPVIKAMKAKTPMKVKKPKPSSSSSARSRAR